MASVPKTKNITEEEKSDQATPLKSQASSISGTSSPNALDADQASLEGTPKSESNQGQVTANGGVKLDLLKPNAVQTDHGDAVLSSAYSLALGAEHCQKNGTSTERTSSSQAPAAINTRIQTPDETQGEIKCNQSQVAANGGGNLDFFKPNAAETDPGNAVPSSANSLALGAEHCQNNCTNTEGASSSQSPAAINTKIQTPDETQGEIKCNQSQVIANGDGNLDLLKQNSVQTDHGYALPSWAKSRASGAEHCQKNGTGTEGTSSSQAPAAIDTIETPKEIQGEIKCNEGLVIDKGDGNLDPLKPNVAETFHGDAAPSSAPSLDLGAEHCQKKSTTDGKSSPQATAVIALKMETAEEIRAEIMSWNEVRADCERIADVEDSSNDLEGTSKTMPKAEPKQETSEEENFPQEFFSPKMVTPRWRKPKGPSRKIEKTLKQLEDNLFTVVMTFSSYPAIFRAGDMVRGCVQIANKVALPCTKITFVCEAILEIETTKFDADTDHIRKGCLKATLKPREEFIKNVLWTLESMAWISYMEDKVLPPGFHTLHLAFELPPNARATTTEKYFLVYYKISMIMSYVDEREHKRQFDVAIFTVQPLPAPFSIEEKHRHRDNFAVGRNVNMDIGTSHTKVVHVVLRLPSSYFKVGSKSLVQVVVPHEMTQLTQALCVYPKLVQHIEIAFEGETYYIRRTLQKAVPNLRPGSKYSKGSNIYTFKMEFKDIMPSTLNSEDESDLLRVKYTVEVEFKGGFRKLVVLSQPIVIIQTLVDGQLTVEDPKTDVTVGEKSRLIPNGAIYRRAKIATSYHYPADSKLRTTTKEVLTSMLQRLVERKLVIVPSIEIKVPPSKSKHKQTKASFYSLAMTQEISDRVDVIDIGPIIFSTLSERSTKEEESMRQFFPDLRHEELVFDKDVEESDEFEESGFSTSDSESEENDNVPRPVEQSNVTYEKPRSERLQSKREKMRMVQYFRKKAEQKRSQANGQNPEACPGPSSSEYLLVAKVKDGDTEERRRKKNRSRWEGFSTLSSVSVATLNLPTLPHDSAQQDAAKFVGTGARPKTISSSSSNQSTKQVDSPKGKGTGSSSTVSSTVSKKDTSRTDISEQSEGFNTSNLTKKQRKKQRKAEKKLQRRTEKEKETENDTDSNDSNRDDSINTAAKQQTENGIDKPKSPVKGKVNGKSNQAGPSSKLPEEKEINNVTTGDRVPIQAKETKKKTAMDEAVVSSSTKAKINKKLDQHGDINATTNEKPAMRRSVCQSSPNKEGEQVQCLTPAKERPDGKRVRNNALEQVSSSEVENSEAGPSSKLLEEAENNKVTTGASVNRSSPTKEKSKIKTARDEDVVSSSTKDKINKKLDQHGDFNVKANEKQDMCTPVGHSSSPNKNNNGEQVQCETFEESLSPAKDKSNGKRARDHLLQQVSSSDVENSEAGLSSKLLEEEENVKVITGDSVDQSSPAKEITKQKTSRDEAVVSSSTKDKINMKLDHGNYNVKTNEKQDMCTPVGHSSSPNKNNNGEQVQCETFEESLSPAKGKSGGIEARDHTRKQFSSPEVENSKNSIQKVTANLSSSPDKCKTNRNQAHETTPDQIAIAQGVKAKILPIAEDDVYQFSSPSKDKHSHETPFHDIETHTDELEKYQVEIIAIENSPNKIALGIAPCSKQEEPTVDPNHLKNGDQIGKEQPGNSVETPSKSSNGVKNGLKEQGNQAERRTSEKPQVAVTESSDIVDNGENNSANIISEVHVKNSESKSIVSLEAKDTPRKKTKRTLIADRFRKMPGPSRRNKLDSEEDSSNVIPKQLAQEPDTLPSGPKSAQCEHSSVRESGEQGGNDRNTDNELLTYYLTTDSIPTVFNNNLLESKNGIDTGELGCSLYEKTDPKQTNPLLSKYLQKLIFEGETYYGKQMDIRKNTLEGLLERHDNYKSHNNDYSSTKSFPESHLNKSSHNHHYKINDIASEYRKQNNITKEPNSKKIPADHKSTKRPLLTTSDLQSHYDEIKRESSFPLPTEPKNENLINMKNLTLKHCSPFLCDNQKTVHVNVMLGNSLNNVTTKTKMPVTAKKINKDYYNLNMQDCASPDPSLPFRAAMAHRNGWNTRMCSNIFLQHTNFMSHATHRQGNIWATETDFSGNPQAIIAKPVLNQQSDLHLHRNNDVWTNASNKRVNEGFRNHPMTSSSHRPITSTTFNRTDEECKSLKSKIRWYSNMIGTLEAKLNSDSRFDYENYRRLGLLKEEVNSLNNRLRQLGNYRCSQIQKF